MGQKLFDDKITTLSESGGTITLASGARLTIGGQQYVTTSNLNVVALLDAGSQRRQIYAVLNSGVVELVISANENSVGPAGYAAWKLVGSYIVNGNLVAALGFGSFLNIEGIPATGLIDYDIQFVSSNAASMNVTFESQARYHIKGDEIFIQLGARCIALPPNNGSFGWSTPSNVNINATTVSGGTVTPGVGSAEVNDAGSTNNSANLVAAGSQISAQFTNIVSGGIMGTTTTTNSLFNWAVGDSIAGHCHGMMGTSGLGYTSIKDR